MKIYDLFNEPVHAEKLMDLMILLMSATGLAEANCCHEILVYKGVTQGTMP